MAEKFLAEKIELLPLSSLKAAVRNSRVHSKRQLQQIAASIESFGFTNPVLIDDAAQIVAGHGRVEAARTLGLVTVPCIRLGAMSDEEKRLYALADNAIALKSGWDKEALALELGELRELNVNIELSGFELPEIDQILMDASEAAVDGPKEEDHAAPPPLQDQAVSRRDDVWTLGRHRLVCGDAKSEADLAALMGCDLADMVFTDPPYNIKIQGVVRGRGKAKHQEFAEASGEMTPSQFTDFLTTSLRRMTAVCKDGAILFTCMDWRHQGELIAAGAAAGLVQKNLCVWVKTNGGQGTFYRSKHELIFVWKNGAAENVNTFGLGEAGRSRTNVWPYAGVNTFKAGRAEELAVHPTVKPVALVVDAIRDVSHRGHIVLDAFGGSGTTLIAAEKVGRVARLMEINPGYCDAIIARWEKLTGKSAVLAATGEDFEATAISRRAVVDAAAWTDSKHQGKKPR